MVGLGRLELPTSRLSGVRSNHLSYRPGIQVTADQACARPKKEKRRRRNPSVGDRVAGVSTCAVTPTCCSKLRGRPVADLTIGAGF